MYTTLYHPTLGARKFWTGDAKALLSCGWYDDPAKFPSPPEPVFDAVEPSPEPARRGRPRK